MEREIDATALIADIHNWLSEDRENREMEAAAKELPHTPVGARQECWDFDCGVVLQWAVREYLRLQALLEDLNDDRGRLFSKIQEQEDALGEAQRWREEVTVKIFGRSNCRPREPGEFVAAYEDIFQDREQAYQAIEDLNNWRRYVTGLIYDGNMDTERSCADIRRKLLDLLERTEKDAKEELEEEDAKKHHG